MGKDINFLDVDVDSWCPPSELPDLRNRSVIAIDLETKDPNLRKHGPGWGRNDGEVIGYAVAADGWSGYCPIGHDGGGNMDPVLVRRWLNDILGGEHAIKVGHNMQYDLGWMKRDGVYPKGKIVDTMMTASLLDENRMGFSLNALCYDWLGKTKSEKLLVEAAKSFGVNPKSEMYKLPAMFVGPYAQVDAELALELYHYEMGQIDLNQLRDIFDLEMELLPMLVDMTFRGIRIDTDAAEIAREGVKKRMVKIQKALDKEAGGPISVWAGNDLAKAFDNMGMAYGRTPINEETGSGGNPSFTAGFLETQGSTFATNVVEMRKLSKVAGTFIDGILEHASDAGRIHSHINQLRSDDGGTITGRLSMSNPNLQQIPARDPELKKMVRGLFLPEEGEEWCVLDYSQQEPMLAVHYADAWGAYRGRPLRGVEEMIKMYQDDPDADFHSFAAALTGIGRTPSKAIGLGRMYGMGKRLMAANLGITIAEAEEMLGKFDANMPFLKELAKAVESKVQDPRSGGSIRTLRGRMCRFDKWEPSSFGQHKAMAYEEAVAAHGPHVRLKRAMTYKALNKLIQGSAADMTKQAMVNLGREGVLPMLQVHDDLNFSVSDRSVIPRYKEIMESAVELAVPVRCDVEIGPNWGAAKEIDLDKLL